MWSVPIRGLTRGHGDSGTSPGPRLPFREARRVDARHSVQGGSQGGAYRALQPTATALHSPLPTIQAHIPTSCVCEKTTNRALGTAGVVAYQTNSKQKGRQRRVPIRGCGAVRHPRMRGCVVAAMRAALSRIDLREVGFCVARPPTLMVLGPGIDLPGPTPRSAGLSRQSTKEGTQKEEVVGDGHDAVAV